MNKLDKICYDLALLYAHSKLEHALNTKTVPETPEDVNPEVNYLADMFYASYEELKSYDSSVFYDLTDEPDI